MWGKLHGCVPDIYTIPPILKEMFAELRVSLWEEVEKEKKEDSVRLRSTTAS